MAFSTSSSRWMSAARIPPSAMVTAKFASRVPSVKMPISAGVSSRATTTVCPSEMSWVKTSAIAANWAPRRSRPPRPSSDGLCSSGSFTSGVEPPSESGSDVASGIASAMSGSACSRERWSREPGSRSGPRSGWPSLSGGCVMDLSSPS